MEVSFSFFCHLQVLNAGIMLIDVGIFNLMMFTQRFCACYCQDIAYKWIFYEITYAYNKHLC